jgi:uncharacterized protein (UPF0333 family)
MVEFAKLCMCVVIAVSGMCYVISKNENEDEE